MHFVDAASARRHRRIITSSKTWFHYPAWQEGFVYLLVRQLPYTAKAHKSYDGNKKFQPTRLVQRSLRALISIHGEPHFCAFAVYVNCLTNKYTFRIQIQKWMHKLHGCGLDQSNGSSLQQSKIILFNTTK